MADATNDPMPGTGGQRHQWSIPTDQPWAIGRENSTAEIGLPDTRLADRHATVRWTGQAVEIRALGTHEPPRVHDRPIRHARRRIGQRFSIADNVFEVSGPAQIALVDKQVAAAAATPPPTSAPRPPAATPAYRRWTIPTRQSATIGREGGPAEIALSGLDLAHRHAAVSWTGRAIEIRSTAPQARPFVEGRPVLHARIPVGGRFMIGCHTLVVSAPGEIALVPGQVTAKEPVLRFADVSLKYRGRTEPTLKNLSLELARGEVLAVIGPSGAGKSTMCHGLLGEVELTSGSMVLGQVDLAASRMQASHLMSFVPQQPAMFDNLSVKESLTWVASLRLAADTGFAERAQRVENVIAAMELTGEIHKRIDTLSGGQRKRVSTAMELLSDPSLLVLDEPTSGLDEGLDRKMMDSLRAVAANDCAVIVVTHSMVNLDRADKVLAITGNGRLAFLGPPAALLDAFGANNYAEVMNQLRADRVTAARPQVSQVPLGGATVTASPPTRGSLSRHLPRLIGRELARQRNSARQLAISLVSGILLTVRLAFAASPRGLGGDPRAISSTLIALIVLLTFFSMAQSFAAVVDDRDVIDRESRWSISPASMILARAVTCAPLAVILGVSSVCLYLLIPGHGPLHTVLPNPAGLLLFAVLLPLAAMAIGLLISTLSKSLRQAVFILMGVLALQVIMTGLAPPFEGTPGKVLKALSVLTPSRWAAGGLGADIGIGIPPTEPSQQLSAPPGAHPAPVHPSAVPIDSTPFPNQGIWYHDAAHVYTAAGALVIITVVALCITIWTLRKKLLSTR